MFVSIEQIQSIDVVQSLSSGCTSGTGAFTLGLHTCSHIFHTISFDCRIISLQASKFKTNNLQQDLKENSHSVPALSRSWLTISLRSDQWFDIRRNLWLCTQFSFPPQGLDLRVSFCESSGIQYSDIPKINMHMKKTWTCVCVRMLGIVARACMVWGGWVHRVYVSSLNDTMYM